MRKLGRLHIHLLTLDYINDKRLNLKEITESNKLKLTIKNIVTVLVAF